MVLQPIPAPLQELSLRQPLLPMPAYRYVPGLQPHPWRSQAGHHHQDSLPPMEVLWSSDVRWETHAHFLHACDLFDYRYVWEAHEVWEEIWHAVPTEHGDRSRLQLLIQAAACCLKVHMGHHGPARSLLERCRLRQRDFELKVVDTDRLVSELDAMIGGGDWPLLHPV